jgi:hypothetical protein
VLSKFVLPEKDTAIQERSIESSKATPTTTNNFSWSNSHKWGHETREESEVESEVGVREWIENLCIN